jgi:hypothetical protein
VRPRVARISMHLELVDVDNDLDPRQMRRQRSAIAAALASPRQRLPQPALPTAKLPPSAAYKSDELAPSRAALKTRLVQ